MRISKLFMSLLIGAAVLPAMAHGGYGYGYGGGFRGGHHGGGFEYRQNWGNNWVGPVLGATILGGAIYAANRPVQVVYPPIVTSLPPQEGAYYCSAYQQIYPQVPTCPVPWQIIPYR